jgi:hypothetical protein
MALEPLIFCIQANTSCRHQGMELQKKDYAVRSIILFLAEVNRSRILTYFLTRSQKAIRKPLPTHLGQLPVNIGIEVTAVSSQRAG